MNKQELLQRLRYERDSLLSLIERIPGARFTIPISPGTYSVKDILAHITAYEKALVIWLKEASAGRLYIDPVIDQPDLEGRNQYLYELNQQKDLSEILIEFKATYLELIQCVGGISEKELIDPDLSAWYVIPRWGQQQPLWMCIANDSYEHHHQHMPEIEHWLEFDSLSSLQSNEFSQDEP